MNQSISSQYSFWMQLNPWAIFRDLYVNRGLLWQFTIRNVQIKHKGSYFGLLWSAFTPLLMMGLYYFVFGLIFQRTYGMLDDETGTDFALGLFLSLTLYQFVAEALLVAPLIIVNSPNLVKKVVFPLSILPVATMGAALFHFLVSILLFFVGMLIFGRGLGLDNLWLPVIVLPLVLLTMGLTWLLSCLGVFFRDIGHLMQVVTSIILYGSAVFYSTSMIPAEAWSIMRYNPLIHAIDMSRSVLLWDLPLNLLDLSYLYLSGIVAFILGYAVFQKLKSAFADVM